MIENAQPAGVETLTKSLLDITVESWRFARLFERLLTRLDAGEQARYRGQFRWFQRRLEEGLSAAGLRIVNIEGHPFDPGMAATPVNIEEFEANDTLIVDQMLEPILMGADGLVRSGTVTLRKAGT